jgi:hypothetical protein
MSQAKSYYNEASCFVRREDEEDPRPRLWRLYPIPNGFLDTGFERQRCSRLERGFRAMITEPYAAWGRGGGFGLALQLRSWFSRVCGCPVVPAAAGERGGGGRRGTRAQRRRRADTLSSAGANFEGLRLLWP